MFLGDMGVGWGASAFVLRSVIKDRKKEKGVTEALRLAEDLIFPEAG